MFLGHPVGILMVPDRIRRYSLGTSYMIDLVSILLVPDRAGGVLLRHIHPVNGQLLSQGE